MNDIDRAASQIAAIMQSMSDEALAVILERMDEIGELSPSEVYQIAKANEAKDLQAIRGIMEQRTEQAAAELKASFESVASSSDKWAAPYYKAADVPYGGWQSSQVIRAMIAQGYASQANGILNLANTSAFVYGGMVRSVEATYADMVSKTILGVTTGAEDYRSAIRKTVRELSSNGLRATSYEVGSHAERLAAKGILSVQYPSGRTRRIDTAVRMNVTDGFRQTMQKVRQQQGAEFGADGVEVSAHGLCAKDHLKIQGRRYSLKEYEEMNSALKRPIGAMNCRHTIAPIILGVSPRTYSEADLKMYADLSTEEVTWTGLGGGEMKATRYQATQYQRQMEASLRTKRSEAKAFAALGDTTEAKRCETQTKALDQEYRKISREIGLRPQMYRTDDEKAVRQEP